MPDDHLVNGVSGTPLAMKEVVANAGEGIERM